MLTTLGLFCDGILPFVWGIRYRSITLAALVRLQRSQEGVYGIIATARKLCITPSLEFLNSCIKALGDQGDVYGACQVMDRIIALGNMEPDAVSYNSLAYALVQDPWVSEVGQAKHCCDYPHSPFVAHEKTIRTVSDTAV